MIKTQLIYIWKIFDMEKLVAIIDCGTNTFHLLIIQEQGDVAKELYRDRVAVRIGKGGISDGKIIPEAADRAITTLKDFKKTIDLYDVKEIHAFATSAFRNASNGEDVRDLIMDRTGINIEIISGEREAELIYEGVNAALAIGKEPALIMDIGGGSVEFIIATENDLLWKHSFEIGAQRLLDRFHQKDPIPGFEMLRMTEFLENNLQALFDAMAQHKPQTLIGSSGTFETLSDIYCEEHGIKYNENLTELPLSLAGYLKIHEQLMQASKEERMAIPGMVEMRVDMIVVASYLIKFLLDRYDFHNIRVSTYAMKEGMLKQLSTQHF